MTCSLCQPKSSSRPRRARLLVARPAPSPKRGVEFMGPRACPCFPTYVGFGPAAIVVEVALRNHQAFSHHCPRAPDAGPYAVGAGWRRGGGGLARGAVAAWWCGAGSATQNIMASRARHHCGWTILTSPSTTSSSRHSPPGVAATRPPTGGAATASR